MKTCEFKGKWSECPDRRPWPWESTSCIDMFGDECCSPAKKEGTKTRLHITWDIIRHDDGEINTAEHHGILQALMWFLESKGYCGGGSSICLEEDELSPQEARIVALEKRLP